MQILMLMDVRLTSCSFSFCMYLVQTDLSLWVLQIQQESLCFSTHPVWIKMAFDECFVKEMQYNIKEFKIENLKLSIHLTAWSLYTPFFFLSMFYSISITINIPLSFTMINLCSSLGKSCYFATEDFVTYHTKISWLY